MTDQPPTDWEVAARTQAARADYLEDLLRKVLEIAGPVEAAQMDARDDRLGCEQDGCGAMGWPADGFVGTRELAWCPQHAPPVGRTTSGCAKPACGSCGEDG